MLKQKETKYDNQSFMSKRKLTEDELSFLESWFQHTCTKRNMKSFPHQVPEEFKVKEMKTKRAKKGEKLFRNPTTHPSLSWPKNHPDESFTVFSEEAGWGALCGPLSTCSVYVKDAILLDQEGNPIYVHDSKTLNPHEREKAYDQLLTSPSIEFSIYHMDAKEFDELTPGPAWKEGINRTINELKAKLPQVTQALIDGSKTVPNDEVTIICESKADMKYIGVAAASILAKVSRDRAMISLGEKYPEFKDIMAGKKKGYWSEAHKDLILKGTFTEDHRKTYNPLKNYLQNK